MNAIYCFRIQPFVDGLAFIELRLTALLQAFGFAEIGRLRSDVIDRAVSAETMSAVSNLV